jgi:hypothetical protein
LYKGGFVNLFVYTLNLLHDSDLLGLATLEWFFLLTCSMGFTLRNKNDC